MQLIALLIVLAAPTAEDRAVESARTGLTLFQSGNYEQALVEFQRAHKLNANSDYLFNMAQCEYHLDRLREALGHYQQFIAAAEKDRSRARSESLELARARIDAIENRQGVLVINSVPDGVDVKIEGPSRLAGQAPNQFRVDRGHYRVTVSMTNFVAQTREFDVGIAETKPLFFKLEPNPAHLEIRTVPRNATLYVRGNRAQNPYDQEVEPGTYEIYGEATNYAASRDAVSLSPGEHRVVDFVLPYVQRSGRPELIWFWTAAGAAAGSTAVLARLENLDTAASGTLVLAGGLAGGIVGAVGATSLVPDYIRDNLALFRIGAMWIGAVEGGATGLVLARKLSMSAGWLGGAAGLGVGAIAGTALDDKAPNYGRVAMIQSAAAWGLAGGVMAVPALRMKALNNEDWGRLGPIGALVGLNVGLGAGLAMAYLPDQHLYGPTWERVMLVNLAGAAGAFAGALATTVEECIARNSTVDCGFDSDQRTARFALAGAAVGIVAGWVSTRNYDKNNTAPTERKPVETIAVPTALSVDGKIVPGLMAAGRF